MPIFDDPEGSFIIAISLNPLEQREIRPVLFNSQHRERHADCLFLIGQSYRHFPKLDFAIFARFRFVGFLKGRISPRTQ